MSLLLASLVALLPIVTVFVLLVVARRPASQAMPGALGVTALVAGLVWRVPVTYIGASLVQGLVIAAEILFIVFGCGSFRVTRTNIESGSFRTTKSSPEAL